MVILTNDISQLATVNYWQVFMGICTIMVGVVGLFALVTAFLNIIGKPIKWIRKNDDDHEKIVQLQEKQTDINTKLDNLCNAMMESMCDRIEQKARYYINILDGVPEDEVDSFSSLYQAYKKIGGNHSAEIKYNYCINNLDLLPVSKKYEAETKKHG